MPNKIDPEWPHEFFEIFPKDLVVLPRTAYYKDKGVLVWHDLEKLMSKELDPIFEAFDSGVLPHEFVPPKVVRSIPKVVKFSVSVFVWYVGFRIKNDILDQDTPNVEV